jgi:hypothetical protein
MPRKRNLEGERQALNMRLQGVPIAMVAEKLGVSSGTVSAWTRGLLPTRYDLHFLDRDDELRAYFLGLFMADGWLSRRGQAYVSLNDKQLIDDLTVATKYRANITRIPLRKWGTKKLSGSYSYRIGFGYRPAQVLRELGITAEKTGHEIIPPLSDTMFPHFLRGVSDGDGTMGVVKNRGRSYLQWSLVSASREFLEGILARLGSRISSRASVHQKKTKRGHIYKLQFGQSDSLAVGELAYTGSTLRLNRKYAVWLVGKELPLHHRSWTLEEVALVKLGQRPGRRSMSAFYSKRAQITAQQQAPG